MATGVGPWESNVPPKTLFRSLLVSLQTLWACSLLHFDPLTPSVSNSYKKMAGSQAGPGGYWKRVPDLVIEQLDLTQYLIPLNHQHFL